MKQSQMRLGLALFTLAFAASTCGRDPGPASDRPVPASESGAPGGSGPLFEDVTAAAGLVFTHQLADGHLSNIMESDGAGGTFLDYDGDGYVDVYLVNSGPAPVLTDAPPDTPRWPNKLFRNRGDGTFEDVTERAGVAGHGFGTTAAAADYDNDGHTDLFVVNFGGCILYRNRGDGTFEDVTAAAGIATRQAGISATFLDADLDGHLDLFVANYLIYDPEVKLPAGSTVPYPGPLFYEPEFNLLYRNRGDGTFEDVSEEAGIRIPGHRAMSVTPLDYDLDGDQDLYVSNDATANLLLVNDGRGRFRDVALESGVAFNQFGEVGGSMGAAVGDANGNGFPDLLVTRFEKASLYINLGQGLFEDRIAASGILAASPDLASWGGNFIDFDNDGDQDVLLAFGDPHALSGLPPLLLENQGAAVFLKATAKAGPALARPLNARGSGVFDLDNDGRLDLLITTLGDRAVLFRNRAPSDRHWLKLELTGTRCNRDALGALVTLTAGGRTFRSEVRCATGYVFQQEHRLHFGLDRAQRADTIEIRWPDGSQQILRDVPADQVLRIRQPDRP